MTVVDIADIIFSGIFTGCSNGSSAGLSAIYFLMLVDQNYKDVESHNIQYLNLREGMKLLP